jgi:histidine triad (HIT) family protein
MNKMKRNMEDCRFCQIVQGKIQSFSIFEDDAVFAFLDHRPLFPGHTLLIPKKHIETIFDLPEVLLFPYFKSVKKLSKAVMLGMNAEGCLLAINNVVSQSVPHLHTHIVPRKKKDGLKGFFWPRYDYKNKEEIQRVQEAIQATLLTLTANES